MEERGIAPTYDKEGHKMVVACSGMAVVPPDNILSEVHQSLHPSLMPLHPHMLRICPTGPDEARSHKRSRPRHLAYIAMQPMGRAWLRPRAIDTSQGEQRWRKEAFHFVVSNSFYIFARKMKRRHPSGIADRIYIYILIGIKEEESKYGNQFCRRTQMEGHARPDNARDGGAA